MIHDHELELAAAAIDFELTPTERARLDRAIAECSVCARAAASYRREASLLEALPVLDASPSVRRHVERTAGLRPQRTAWTWVWLAAAMLGLLVTSVLVVGAINDRRNLLVDVAPTPAPTATPAPPAPSNAPSPDVIALDPPSGELANVGPALAHDSLALVVTDNLRLRSAPFVGDLSIRHKRLLQPDDRLFVIDGPVIAQNYEWYQVKAWRPRQPSVSWPVGWVARAGHDGEVWVQSSSRSCPPQTVDIGAFLELAPVERLACFRDTPVEVRAVVAEAASIDCDVRMEGCATGPEWLASALMVASVSSSQQGAPPGLAVAFDPNGQSTPADLTGAGVVRLQGTFDHAEATACRPDPARAGPDGPLSSVEAVLRCRSRFVVTNATAEPFPRRTDKPAITVSDRLRVRSLPEISDASVRYDPLLPIGTRLWVLDGPTLADDYAWYEVIAPISADSRTVSSWLVGWVAAAGKDGERWIEDQPIECPAADTTLTLRDLALVRQRPVDDGPLTCLGSDEIQIEGIIAVACRHGEAGSTPMPSDWLSDLGGRWIVISQGGRTMQARFDPAGTIDLPCGQTRDGPHRITGHFDDPAASACTPASVGLAGTTDVRAAIYRCRTSFVATRVEPLTSPVASGG